MKTFLSVACLLFFTACGNDDTLDDVYVDYDQAFTLRIGQRAITSDGAQLKLIDIPTDSRCALNATYVWEGEIVAELEGAHGGVSIPIELKHSPGQTDPVTANFIRFQVELIEANPYPDLNKKNGQIKRDDSELKLVLSGIQ